MIKRILGAFSFFLTVYVSAFAQHPTPLGLHGADNPFDTLGASIVRLGANDYGIKTAIANNDPTALNKLKTLDSLGYTIVYYLIHNEDSVVPPVATAWQRVPTGADSAEVFQYLDTFLLTVGPYIDWVQVNQEPLGITPYDTTTYSLNEILNWWKNLASFIDSKRSANPSVLGHIKILSPSISILQPSPQVEPVIDSMIAFGENYCDAISLHIYPETVGEGRQAINYYTGKTSHPLACSEFSQSLAGVYSGWLDNVNSVWTNTGHPYYNLTNKQVIESAYVSPMDSSDWKLLIATAPYTNNFIAELYASMDSSCFVFACYAGMWQYGEPIFDWTELIANQTVIQYPFPNNPFFSEFIALTTSINNATYSSQCPTISVEENSLPDIVYYPNPATELLTISSGEYLENIQLNLFDLMGKEVYRKNNLQGYNFSIQTSGLSPGIYVLNLKSGNKIVDTRKIIIAPGK